MRSILNVTGSFDHVQAASRPARRRRSRADRLRRASAATVQTLESRMMLSASLLKDINPTFADANPGAFTVSGNSLYFEANDGIHGYQLWKTDGTAAGTKELNNLVPGGTAAFDTTDVNGTLYFFNSSGYPQKVPEPSSELWRTDGTPAGSADLGTFDGPGNLTNVNGTAYFTAYPSVSGGGAELFRSDGAPGGTVLVKSFGYGGGGGGAPTLLTSFNGSLYFAIDSTIWKSDGTAAGTVPVVDTGTVISMMTAVDGRLLIEQHTLNGTILLTSNGTAAPPTVVGTFANSMGGWTAYKGAIYFSTTDANNVSGVWKTDGTAGGTTLVKAIPTYNQFFAPNDFTVFNGTLYFEVTSSATKTDLWRSDGTTQGTVADDELLGSALLPPTGSQLGVFNGNLYFGATDGLHGVQLWRSDGTATGTYQVAQLNTTGAGSGISGSGSVAYAGQTFFFANGGLWKSDGTSAGTTLIADVSGNNLFDFNGTLYFSSFGHLWKSDGTAGGTVPIAGEAPLTYMPDGNVLYFFAFSNNITGAEALYRTDGTTAGTTEVMDVAPTYSMQSMPSMVSVYGTLFFTTIDTSNHVQLYKIGPAGGTPSLLASYNGNNIVPTDLTAGPGGPVFFVANGALCETDGTLPPVTLWQSTNAAPTGLFEFEGSIYSTLDYVTANSSVFPAGGLFRFDFGTRQMQQISGGTPSNVIVTGGKVYFEAYDGAPDGRESLIVTDGTAAGTHDVDRSLGVASNYNDIVVTAADGRVYFIASDGTHGDQLWQADGTTTTLADPSEAAGGWTPTTLIGQTNGGLVFAATDLAHGSEPWVLPFSSDATAAFVRADSTTQGTWTGTYGYDGYAIANGTANLPSYVQLTTTGASTWTWQQPSDGDPRTLQTAPGSTSRLAACDYSNGSFTYDVNLTDGQIHQVAIYALNWDWWSQRNEKIDVRDANTGAVLDTRFLSNFGNGQWLVWNLSGHVTITIGNLGGINAVASGIFFGPPRASAGFVRSDTSLGGTWTGTYGGDGYAIAGDATSLPAYAQLSVSGAQSMTWATNVTTDGRAVQTAPGVLNRIAAADFSTTSFTYDLNLTDGQTHQVALYALNWDWWTYRNETITLSDANTGAVLDRRTIVNFNNGQWLVWNVAGHVKITVTNNGGLNAVVSGLFFDTAPASASFVRSDTSLGGTWTGTYGADGYSMPGGFTSLPPYARLSSTGARTLAWDFDNASDGREVQLEPGSLTRLASADYSDTSFTYDLNLTDGQTHQVALYALNWDWWTYRNETITISDASTGAVLDSRTISNFGNGEWLVWNLSGHVKITVTNNGGANAVISGIFFG